MDIQTLMRASTMPERERLARRVKTSVGYLYLLAGRHRHPSPALAKKLVQADSRLTLPELRPDIWGGS